MKRLTKKGLERLNKKPSIYFICDRGGIAYSSSEFKYAGELDFSPITGKALPIVYKILKVGSQSFAIKSSIADFIWEEDILTWTFYKTKADIIVDLLNQ